ncbi:MAG TPA: RidA family protein [Pyrinomonadaceae bacterium]|nr:RidA family protein [Pyrinomonadaceae bacterium]
MSKEFLNPPDLPNWEQVFSQVVVVPNGAWKTVYLSGQVSVDKDKNLVGGDDLGAQARQALQNLDTALRSVGATAADVVKLNIYVKNYKPADAAPVGEALRHYFPRGKMPASTWLGVQSLAEEGFLIEVDAIAMLDAGASR